MGNCNGLPSTGNQFQSLSDSGVGLLDGGINVQPAPSPPRPQQSSSHHHHPSPAVGRVLGRPMEDVRSTYVFSGELGRGQFGISYLVTHRKTKQQFACKSIPKRKLINSEDIQDVRREVQIMYHLTGHRFLPLIKTFIAFHFFFCNFKKEVLVNGF